MTTKSASMNPLGLKKQNRWLVGESDRRLGREVLLKDQRIAALKSQEKSKAVVASWRQFRLIPNMTTASGRKESGEFKTLRPLQTPEFG